MHSAYAHERSAEGTTCHSRLFKLIFSLLSFLSKRKNLMSASNSVTVNAYMQINCITLCITQYGSTVYIGMAMGGSAL